MSSEKIYMYFGDVAGNVTEINHKNWIEISSFEFSTNRNVIQESGNPKRNIGTPAISKISLTRNMGDSSPGLFLESICGTGQNCIIPFLKGGENMITYIEYKLENAVISQYKQHKDNASPGAHEQIEISFTSIKTVYTPVDASGKKGTPLAIGYDVTGGRRI